VFTSKFVPRFLPSFSWLTDEGRAEAIPEKVMEVAQRVMARRQVAMTETMKELFLRIYQQAHKFESIPDEAGKTSSNES
jgi:hypothetical protein